MAFDPTGKNAGNIGAGDEREIPEISQPRLAPARAGFAEQGALFRAVPDLPVELRALRGYADPVFLRFAAARAEELDVGADLVVARSGAVAPDAMLEAYAADLGVEVDWLEGATTARFDAAQVLLSGTLPARDNDERPTIAFVPGNAGALYARATDENVSGKNFRITSAARLRAFVERSAADRLAEDAAFGLRDTKPEFSAATTYAAYSRVAFLAALLAGVLAFYFAPGPSRLVTELILAVIFMSWAGLRIFACLSRTCAETSRPIHDRDLPSYTILVPLYREAKVASQLIAAISALNYPREKLDVKLILEPDDAKTIAAIDSIKLDPCFEIIRAPLRGPRTKPKALRAAMPFVRGEFVVIYDAEDRPHPDQLREAYAKFAAADSELACVQAKLAINHKYWGFLSGHFRAEYSGLFDVLLPALARLRLPLPLGGTSNHFRTSILRETGTWDPHNVTEDADLGVRLARLGYKTDVVDSTTFEEAPVELGTWLRQRTRWMKGWMQTYMVHMRDPLLLFRQLGWRGFFTFQLLIGGSVLAALVHPVFAALLVTDAGLGSLFESAESPAEWARKALVFFTLTSGYLASGLLAFIGMRRRGIFSSGGVLLTIPVYWLLLSAAAWRAVWKLITAPYQWEKTAHGVATRRQEIT